MKKIELTSMANMPDNDIATCDILESHPGFIRFTVDKGIELPEEHLDEEDSRDIINKMLKNQQIDSSLAHVIACSFSNIRLNYLSTDILYKTIITCYAEHRPLVLSPDMIWLLIVQTIAKHINDHAEEYREKLVNFEGKKDLEVKSQTDLFDPKTNWALLLEQMCDKIITNTQGDLASTSVCDFSTTGENEKIASFATIMETMKAYFRYHITHCICGIPHITLLGTPEDWKRVLEKAAVLKTLEIEFWYEWLHPILNEFIRAANGRPNLKFWKSIVLKASDNNLFSLGGGGCLPDFQEVDGWCAALFPFIDGEEQDLESCYNRSKMDNEMTRTKFLYHRITPIKEEVFPMELWAGFVGVEENKKTFALTPKIGWFVRQSNEEEESLARLKKQDAIRGIELRIDSVPEILQKLDHIEKLKLYFENNIKLPEWLMKMDIESISAFGEITDTEKERLLAQYANLSINDNDYYDYD